MGAMVGADVILFIMECIKILTVYRLLLNGTVSLSWKKGLMSVAALGLLCIFNYGIMNGESVRLVVIMVRLLVCYMVCSNGRKNRIWGIVISYTLVNTIDSIPGIIYRVGHNGIDIMDAADSPLRAAVVSMIYAAVYFTISHIIHIRCKDHSYRLDALTVRYKISILLILFACILAVGGSQLLLLEKLNQSVRTVLVTGIMCVCIIMVFLCIVQIILYNSRNYYKELSKSKAEIIELNSRYYELQKVHYDAARRKQHDYNKHLRCIKQLGLEGEYEKQQEYIDKLTGSSTLNKGYIDCGSTIISAVVTDAYIRAGSMELEMTCEGHIERIGAIDETDMCILVSNILDNALEACQKVETGAKRIGIHMGYSGNRIYIRVDNSTLIKQLERNALMTSDKNSNGEHGIGMRNIAAIVDKYGGSVMWSVDNYIFTIEIIM